ncbi:MAG: glycosyltransferase family 2 protein [Patescibacteria group bacterium]|jgi:glycosyltransferase involved in cell wall biosynthesis
MNALSIIVPCYNEAKNIPLILKKFAAIIVQQPIEVILVNNGSTDASASIFAEELKNHQYNFARVVTVLKNIGYGHGIMTGLQAASGEVLAWTHADLQTDPADVLTAYRAFVEINTPDKIIIKGKRINRKFTDWAFTFGMSLITSVVLRTALYDINGQPKMFHKTFLDKMINPPTDFSLDLYTLYLAKKNDYTIKTIPVNFSKRLYGESKWAFSFSSKYKTILRTIKYIFQLHGHLHSSRK